MAAAAQQTALEPTVGKKALAEFLGWSRPTLDARLNKDPHFPVVRRGDQSGGWAFDANAVRRYLDGVVDDAPAAEEPEDEPVEIANVVRLAPGQTKGEQTARQMKDMADYELKLDRLARQRLELLTVPEVREVLATVLVEMRTTLTGIPDMLVKEFGLSERQGFAARARIEGAMRGMVTKLRVQLGVEAPDA